MLMQTMSASDIFRLKGSNQLTSSSAKIGARYMKIYSAQNKAIDSYSNLSDMLSFANISCDENIYMNAEQVKAFDRSLIKVGGLVGKGRFVDS